jgi:hypothetical protein
MQRQQHTSSLVRVVPSIRSEVLNLTVMSTASSFLTPSMTSGMTLLSCSGICQARQVEHVRCTQVSFYVMIVVSRKLACAVGTYLTTLVRWIFC